MWEAAGRGQLRSPTKWATTATNQFRRPTTLEAVAMNQFWRLTAVGSGSDCGADLEVLEVHP